MNIEEFVNKYFGEALKAFQKEGIAQEISNLSIFEKTIIYKYALDYYEDLNYNLRYGRLTPVQQLFAKFLNEALDKLPNYEGFVYRGVRLSQSKIKKYEDALASGTPIVEKGFSSTSTSSSVAEQFSGGEVIFYIESSRGKSIELLSHYGTHNSQNEKEILFKSETTFSVLGIKQIGTKTIITLEEII